VAKPWRDEQWPSVGRIVHIRLSEYGECRAAVIVRTDGTGPNAAVELFVFPSSHNDVIHDLDWLRDEWHWPEYVGPAAE
jgi:hypothetical protein